MSDVFKDLNVVGVSLDEYTVVLGAADPEMGEIERVLQNEGIGYVYATVGGKRTHTGNAYEADTVESDKPYCFIECGFNDYQPNGCDIEIDHHKPGDFGYGAAAEHYMSASSIGQLLMLLGMVPNKEQHMVAAADHCLGAAYAGKCPGVDPDELMMWRIKSRAAFQKRSADSILEDVRKAREYLKTGPTTVIAGETVVVAEVRVPELPEAAAREGVSILSTVTAPGGEKKQVLFSQKPETVKEFMRVSESLGARHYGDPIRGYAGRYLN